MRQSEKHFKSSTPDKAMQPHGNNPSMPINQPKTADAPKENGDGKPLFPHAKHASFWLGIFVWVTTAAILIGLTSAVGFSVWNRYKDDIIQKQEEQLLIIADSLADNLEGIAAQYAQDLTRAGELVQRVDAFTHLAAQDKLTEERIILQDFIAGENHYTKNIGLFAADGTPIWQHSDMEYVQEYDRCDMGGGITMTEKKGADGNIYFVFQKQIASEKCVEIVLDVRKCYQNIIADIHLGTNGYVVVKNRDGYLFMHPVDAQIGVTALSGREALYGDLDLESLQKVFQEQNENQSGISEYYSYWWENETLPRVKKVAAFSHADIGNQFLVVSAVMDYNDIYSPIISGFTAVTLTIGGITVVLLAFAGMFAYSAVQTRKSKNEIRYLKNLNETLEQIKQGEEALAHQQRLQIIGTMTGGIAHEFNNMLTPIMGYSEMLLDRLPPESDEYDDAQEIFDASERAKEIIHQISGMSRKNMETVYSFIPAKKMIVRSVKMIRSVCPANVQLNTSDTFGDEGFLGNETQINQVLLNISVNAFHAIGQKPDGKVNIEGVQVDKETLEKEHQLTLDDVWTKFLKITIRDNGCGMDAETRRQIFNPFFTTKAPGKGTGLGLSVVEQIIHSHKGFIFVESALGKGTTFTIYLPVTQASSLAAKTEIEERKESDLSILVVDDNAKILKMLEKKFGKLGIRVQTVESAAQANEALKAHPYGVLLIDQDLTKTGNDDTGIRYAMTLKTTYPDLIKIIMTDQVKRKLVEAKQNGYIDSYIEKPVSDEKIIEEIYQIQKQK